MLYVGTYKHIYIYIHVYIYTCRSIPRILRLRDLFNENTVLKGAFKGPKGLWRDV